ncbi:unnamed protein product [Mytilus coruscus]|uniref:MULE transposase domain-containing protein n=1 Tax=Mytilus coruscus TaxID=42192 RepID=A0A6J8CR70_MYTCO|nr:unnamed protein product [Mytilus coruscus]
MNQPSNRNNKADEILEVLSMLNEHPFVQQVNHKKGQVPSIISYTEDQMTDFKMFLARSGGAVGVHLELRIPEELVFGSDNEKALTKAITDAFPKSTRLLCTKHLKDNLKHYLQNKVGVDVKERTKLMDVIFGTEGVVNADNTIDFEEKSTAIKWKPQSTPDFIRKIYDCVLAQFFHLRGALHGHGDFVLKPSEMHYWFQISCGDVNKTKRR